MLGHCFGRILWGEREDFFRVFERERSFIFQMLICAIFNVMSLTSMFFIILNMLKFLNLAKKEPSQNKKVPAKVPWVQKQPKSLQGLAHQNQIVRALKGILTTGQLPHLLLYGPAGTGKTSSILALAKQLFGQQLYKQKTLQLNASDERGISVVRDKIKKFAKSMVSKSGIAPFKLIILDQADSMTHQAQSALRRIMQDYSESTRFCIICNYISKIIDPIGSRCIKFRFNPVPVQSQVERLQFICTSQQVSCEKQALFELVKVSGGDLRKSVNLLQLCSTSFDQRIGSAEVKTLCGGLSSKLVQQTTKLITSAKNFQSIQEYARQFQRQGFSLLSLLEELVEAVICSQSIKQQKKASLLASIGDCEQGLCEGGSQFTQLLNMLLQCWMIFK